MNYFFFVLVCFRIEREAPVYSCYPYWQVRLHTWPFLNVLSGIPESRDRIGALHASSMQKNSRNFLNSFTDPYKTHCWLRPLFNITSTWPPVPFRHKQQGHEPVAHQQWKAVRSGHVQSEFLINSKSHGNHVGLSCFNLLNSKLAWSLNSRVFSWYYFWQTLLVGVWTEE